MSDSSHVVVVGAGQAGGELVAAMRSAGHSGPVSLIGAEPTHPYGRPPLSKGYLLGTTDAGELLLRAPSMYTQHQIDLRLDSVVTDIDRASKTVRLADGETVGYSTLVLATGGRPRRLLMPGLDAGANVLYMRTLDDADRLRSRLVAGGRLIIIGGGYIGLEIAAVAQRRGLSVTVVEAEARVLARVAAPPLSDFFRRVHVEEGVDIRVNTTIVDCTTDARGDVREVRLSDGDVIACDAVLVGVGLVPNTELAEAAGLTVDDGIVVDSLLRTSDQDVYAIGDVARHPDPDSGDLHRLESVPNALEQAKALAETIVGRSRPYDAVPRFWSDQYDVKLQLVGLCDDAEETVIRGPATSARQFAMFHLKGGVVRSAAVANSPRDYAMARRLVTERLIVDPARLADTSLPPRELLQTAHSV